MLEKFRFIFFSQAIYIYTIPFNSSVWFPLKQRFILFYFMLFHFRCVCAFFFIVFFVLLHSHRDFVCFRLFSIFFAVVHSFCWFFIGYSALFAYLSFIRLQYSYVKTKKKSFENCCSSFLTYRSWSATQILHTLQMDVPYQQIALFHLLNMRVVGEFDRNSYVFLLCIISLEVFFMTWRIANSFYKIFQVLMFQLFRNHLWKTTMHSIAYATPPQSMRIF